MQMRSRILVPTAGPCAWKTLLADPDRHWKRGRSAYELAVSWEEAQASDQGIPATVADTLNRFKKLEGSKLLLAIPEHKVPLPGGARASQSDLWGLLMSKSGRLISMCVEGKAGESFGPTIGEWRKKASGGKRERLNYLANELGVQNGIPNQLRYQLFHRTASTIIEAKRFGATIALMMVQSFAPDEKSWNDFLSFVSFLGAEVKEVRKGRVVPILREKIDKRTPGARIELFVAWVDCKRSMGTELVCDNSSHFLG